MLPPPQWRPKIKQFWTWDPGRSFEAELEIPSGGQWENVFFSGFNRQNPKIVAKVMEIFTSKKSIWCSC
jgi:hypothetical protein